eukprot:6179822-Pleurochrysis_carterae.AAC.3
MSVRKLEVSPQPPKTASNLSFTPLEMAPTDSTSVIELAGLVTAMYRACAAYRMTLASTVLKCVQRRTTTRNLHGNGS